MTLIAKLLTFGPGHVIMIKSFREWPAAPVLPEIISICKSVNRNLVIAMYVQLLHWAWQPAVLGCF